LTALLFWPPREVRGPCSAIGQSILSLTKPNQKQGPGVTQRAFGKLDA
jgi:hypothetical protein